MTHETAPGGAADAAVTAIPATAVTMPHPGKAGKPERSGDGVAKSEIHPTSFRLLPPHPVCRSLALLPGDCALPDTLRRCKVVDFREGSEAGFAEVPTTLRDTLLPKLLSCELRLPVSTRLAEVAP